MTNLKAVSYFSHGGNAAEIEQETGRKIIDFSANINPLGLPTAVKNVLCHAAEITLRYPDPKNKELKEKISRFWGVPSDSILLGNGSAELIYLICLAFRPGRVFIPAPTFSEYERASLVAGSKVSFVNLDEEKGFTLKNTIPSKGALFICNPNNPTGNLVLKKKETVGFKGLIIVDEAFMDFLPDEKKFTLIYEAVENPRLIVLRTFTKIFALPGLRIGYLVANRKTVDFLKQYMVPWNINTLAQSAASAALNQKEYLQKTRVLVKTEREFLMQAISEIESLKPFRSTANFILIKIMKEEINSASLRTALIKQGLLIRNCDNFHNLNNRFIRVAVRNHSENLKLIAGFKKIFCGMDEIQT